MVLFRWFNMKKILAIGNSFADDSFEYLSRIDHDIIIGVLYIGGCSLKMHRDNLENNKSLYTYRKDVGYGLVSKDNVKMTEALLDEKWDIITFQQASYDSGNLYSYNEDLDYLLLNVRKIVGEKVKFYWLMTWAYDVDSNHEGFKLYHNNQQEMYESILKCIDLIKNKFFDILYVGKIIQIARENKITNLTRDFYHLSLDIGRFIASLYIYKNLISKNIDNIKYYPTSISNDEFIKIKELIKDN